jgi:DNA-binding NarL/FixJ family response regulator
MAEYYFTLDFKYALSKKIKKIKIEQSYTNSKKYTCYYIPEPLVFLTNWQKYLLKLLYLGYNNSEISQITQLSRKTIIKERKKLYVYV